MLGDKSGDKLFRWSIYSSVRGQLNIVAPDAESALELAGIGVSSLAQKESIDAVQLSAKERARLEIEALLT